MSMSMGRVAVLDQPATTYGNLDLLVTEVQRACARPVNQLQVAALLESAGVTQAVAMERYQHPDVFALAGVVAKLMRSTASAPVAVRRVAAPPPERRMETMMDYMRGPLALLPIVLLSLTIMVYQGFGQWQTAQVLTMSMAMIGSLLVTGGFVQAFSRKGSSYLSQGYVRAAQHIVSKILVVALVTMLVTAGLLVALLRIAGWLSRDNMGLLAVAYIALSVLWLVAGVLFLLKQAHWFGIGIAVGFGLSCLCLEVLAPTHLARGAIMLLAATVGMTGVLAVSALVIRWTLFRESTASPVGNQPVVLASSAQLLVGLTPYFSYGVLYVAFILSGHVGGWVGALTSAPAPIEAISTIEVALTVALGGYILAGGVAERTMRRFWQQVRLDQAETSQVRPEAFSRTLQGFFLREHAHFLAALVLCSLCVTASVLIMVSLSSGRGVTLLPWSAETTMVFLMGQIGYGLMALGMFSCMFMITLSQPWRAVNSVAAGIAVTIVAGLAIGSALPYQYATLGVVVGGLVFALNARARMWSMLENADYFYYASF